MPLAPGIFSLYSPPSPSSPAPSPNTPIPVKIPTSYAEIQELASEKFALAQQFIELLSKNRARLDIDIVKVKILLKVRIH